MKRMLCIASAAVILFGMCGTGEAKTLEEILREKGVITEEDYQEAIKDNALASYELGKGLTVQTRDGKFLANVGGRLQVRFTYEDFDDSSVDNDASFSIRRMKLWLQGNAFNENLFYKFQAEFGSGSGELQDAYMGYTFAEPFELTIGQMKPPQARQELTSSAKQLFVDRSLANDTFDVGRDIGVAAAGSFAGHLVDYMIGGFNGNGPNEPNVGDDFMFAVRLDINPLGQFKMDEVSFDEEQPLLNIGGSFISSNFVADAAAADDISTDNEIWDQVLDETFSVTFGDKLDYELYTANLNLLWRGANFAAEYYYLHADPDDGSSFHADGYYIQGGYMVIPATLELAARYSAINSGGGAPNPFDEQQYQFGINYYYAKHNAKVQADYTHVNNDEVSNADDNIYRIQAQLIF
jgi:phosphate-selective porin OprO/OprP